MKFSQYAYSDSLLENIREIEDFIDDGVYCSEEYLMNLHNELDGLYHQLYENNRELFFEGDRVKAPELGEGTVVLVDEAAGFLQVDFDSGKCKTYTDDNVNELCKIS